MIKTKIHLISPVFSAVLVMMSSISAYAAEQELVADDGREVLLNDDGSWQYRSTDRFTTTSDGRRVRLKEDGTWSYHGNAPKHTKQQVRTSDLDIKLQKVVVEKYQKKVQKNTRLKTRTAFYLSIKTSQQAKDELVIEAADISHIEVKDNNGKSYPVISIQPLKTIKPGSETVLIIHAEKSPGLFDGVKSMSISFKPGILGLQEAISFTERKADFEDEEVDGFD